MKNPLIKRIFLKSTVKRLETKTKLLGLEDQYNLYSFLYCRLLATVIIFLAILFLIPYGYIFAPLLSILYYWQIELICFDYPLKKRAAKLNREAPYFLEILLLALKSNLTLYQALEKTTSEIGGQLSNEFEKVVKEVKMGKSLNDSLDDLQKRIPSEVINNVIGNIKTANSFGNNILEIVQNELDYIRDEEYLNMKKQLVKIPFYVKLVSFSFTIVTLTLIIFLPIIRNMLT